MSGLAEPTPALLEALAAALGPRGLRPPDEADLTEPRGLWRGRAAAVARPATTAEVATAVRLCAAARVGVVPRGGGTGLVGGQVAGEGPTPILLSLERMAAVRRVDPAEGAMIVEAGATLAAARAAAEAADRLFPLSLASQGSATIGGVLATNAGGTSALRWGSARALALGIEAVLADGSVLAGPSTLRKDNAGYDLRDLIIGAEGTLGVITAAALALAPRPRETATAFVALPDPAAALALLRLAQDTLGETVSAFELMSATGMAFLAAVCPDTPRPPVAGPWFALVEAAGGRGSGVAAGLEAALAEALDRGLATDAAVAQSEAQRAAFWRIREDTPEANRRIGAIASHDVSLPLGALARFVAEAGAAVAAIDPGLRVNCFGHVGDGNLHFNVFPPVGADRAAGAALRPRVLRAVHDLAHAAGGSIAAEHGIGRAKAAELVRYGDPVKLAAMRALKRALDPLGILNPGAVLG